MYQNDSTAENYKSNTHLRGRSPLVKSVGGGGVGSSKLHLIQGQDLIKVSKICKGLRRIRPEELFHFDDRGKGTRGHSLKLVKVIRYTRTVEDIFYSARNARIASAVVAIAIPSVCLSVRPSVTRRHCVKTTARSTTVQLIAPWIVKCV